MAFNPVDSLFLQQNTATIPTSSGELQAGFIQVDQFQVFTYQTKTDKLHFVSTFLSCLIFFPIRFIDI